MASYEHSRVSRALRLTGRVRGIVRLGVGVAVMAAVPAIATAQQVINYASDTTWNVTDASSVPVGTSVHVCLNAGSPPACPAGATLWGYGGSAWNQSRALVPGANWIWAPGLTGASTSAALARYTFTKTFVLNGPPLSGTLLMLADDYVEARVNGTLYGPVGSIVNAGSSGAGLPALVAFNVLASLVQGTNTIAITGQNGPASFGGTVYSTNPAGVVFGGVLTADVTPVPTMSGWLMLLAALLLAVFAARQLRRKPFGI